MQLSRLCLSRVMRAWHKTIAREPRPYRQLKQSPGRNVSSSRKLIDEIANNATGFFVYLQASCPAVVRPVNRSEAVDPCSITMGQKCIKWNLFQLWEFISGKKALFRAQKAFLVSGTPSAEAVDIMQNEQLVSIQQMRDVLYKQTGSKLPVKITNKDGEVMVRHIRGFADPQANVVLISETSYSLAMKILEVKDIRTLQYAPENSDGTWKTLHAKWLIKTNKN